MRRIARRKTGFKRSRRDLNHMRSYQQSKIKIAKHIFLHLNEYFFDNQFEKIDFAWMARRSFRQISKTDGSSLRLHPELFGAKWQPLLEFEIYRQMLFQLEWPLPQGTNSLEFRRAEGKIGNLFKRLKLRNAFIRGLYSKYAKKLKLKHPKDGRLYLYLCKRCGWGTSRLGVDKVHCEQCEVRQPVIMKMWDDIMFVQHYKFSISPADYSISEVGSKKIYLYQDFLIRHFLH